MSCTVVVRLDRTMVERICSNSSCLLSVIIFYAHKHISSRVREELPAADSPLTVRCTQLPLWKVSYCCSSIRTLHSYQPWSSDRTGSICREAFPCREALPVDRGKITTGSTICTFVFHCTHACSSPASTFKGILQLTPGSPASHHRDPS